MTTEPTITEPTMHPAAPLAQGPTYIAGAAQATGDYGEPFCYEDSRAFNHGQDVVVVHWPRDDPDPRLFHPDCFDRWRKIEDAAVAYETAMQAYGEARKTLAALDEKAHATGMYLRADEFRMDEYIEAMGEALDASTQLLAAQGHPAAVLAAGEPAPA